MLNNFLFNLNFNCRNSN